MEDKLLAGFGAAGHSGIHIKSTQTTHVTHPEILKINWTIEPTGWLSGLTDIKMKIDDSDF